MLFEKTQNTVSECTLYFIIFLFAFSRRYRVSRWHGWRILRHTRSIRWQDSRRVSYTIKPNIHGDLHHDFLYQAKRVDKKRFQELLQHCLWGLRDGPCGIIIVFVTYLFFERS